MKKTVAILVTLAVVSGFGMIAFSQTKRPADLTKAEKIQKKQIEAKLEAKLKAEAEAEAAKLAEEEAAKKGN